MSTARVYQATEAVARAVGGFFYEPFAALLTHDGTSAGTPDLIHNATAATKWYFTVPTADIIYIRGVSISLTYLGELRHDKYGPGLTLNSGLEVVTDVASVDGLILTGGEKILRHGDWGKYAQTINTTHISSGGIFFTARWNFLDHFGTSIRLVGAKSERFAVNIGVDDYSAATMDTHRFAIWGHRPNVLETASTDLGQVDPI